MTRSGRFLLATLCGLVLAGIAHLSAVLAIPWLAERDALSRLAETAAADHSVVIQAAAGAPDAGAGETTTTWLPRPDPALAVGACAFNLADGPVRVSARTGALFQSISVHGRGTGAFYAVTDRAAVRGALDLVILTQRQLDELLAREEDDEPSRDVRIVAPTQRGFVIVRVLADLPSERAVADEAARSVACTIDAPSE
jgi:uncharacterized membrane protein